MGFKNTALNLLFNPIGLFEEAGKAFKSSGGGAGSQVPSAPLPLPQAPKPEAAADKAQETIRRKKAAMTQSIYTSPLGIAGEAQVARKVLLGQ